MSRAIALRDLLPKDGGDHAGVLAHLKAVNLFTIGDVEDRADKERVATYRILLGSGMTSTRAEFFVQAIDAVKRRGLVA